MLKKLLTLTLALILCLSCAKADPVEDRLSALENRVAALENASAAPSSPTGLSGYPLTVFEAVRWCVDFPKDSQVLSAAEYVCKLGGQPVHALLIHASQSQFVSDHFGTAAGLMVLDLDTGMLITHTNFIFPENAGETMTRDEALHMLFASFDSHVSFGTEIIVTDSEIVTPLDASDISAINAALYQHFTAR
ncbi:MAG: hypothetical protein IJ507_02975 [Clostridia bacterium]|nr:hypothetical protein [Clostridia bacterium]